MSVFVHVLDHFIRTSEDCAETLNPFIHNPKRNPTNITILILETCFDTLDDQKTPLSGQDIKAYLPPKVFVYESFSSLQMLFFISISPVELWQNWGHNQLMLAGSAQWELDLFYPKGAPVW